MKISDQPEGIDDILAKWKGTQITFTGGSGSIQGSAAPNLNTISSAQNNSLARYTPGFDLNSIIQQRTAAIQSFIELGARYKALKSAIQYVDQHGKDPVDRVLFALDRLLSKDASQRWLLRGAQDDAQILTYIMSELEDVSKNHYLAAAQGRAVASQLILDSNNRLIYLTQQFGGAVGTGVINEADKDATLKMIRQISQQRTTTDNYIDRLQEDINRALVEGQDPTPYKTKLIEDAIPAKTAMTQALLGERLKYLDMHLTAYKGATRLQSIKKANDATELALTQAMALATMNSMMETHFQNVWEFEMPTMRYQIAIMSATRRADNLLQSIYDFTDASQNWMVTNTQAIEVYTEAAHKLITMSMDDSETPQLAADLSKQQASLYERRDSWTRAHSKLSASLLSPPAPEVGYK